MAKQTHSPIDQLRQALNLRYLEREELVDAALCALISGEPMLIVGPPGTAKSAIARDICSAIGGEFFQWMLTRFTVPEELFGPLSLKALEQDKYVRVTTGKLPKAHLVFMDEVGKASTSISNTLLTVMNERVFYNDGKAEPVPMLAMFGASNEIPNSEELGAFYDRFVLRFFVNGLREDSSVESLFRMGTPAPMPSVKMDDVIKLREAAGKVAIPDDVIAALIKLRRGVEKAGILVSDRKWRQCIRLIQAQAAIAGRTKAEIEDGLILQHVLWSTAEQIPQVRKLVNGAMNPLGEKVQEVIDSLNAISASSVKPGQEEQAVEVVKKFNHGIKQLRDLGKGNPKIAALIKNFIEKRDEISSRMLSAINQEEEESI